MASARAAQLYIKLSAAGQSLLQGKLSSLMHSAACDAVRCTLTCVHTVLSS